MGLRNATPGDARTISRIHALSWKSAYAGMVPQAYLDGLKEDFWALSFEDWLGTGRLQAKLLYNGACAQGCVAYGRSRDDTLLDWGEIVSLYLLPDCFGEGYGRKLLQAAAADLRRDGYANIFLWVLRENARARRFYEQNGFHWCGGELTVPIMGHELTDLRYVLT